MTLTVTPAFQTRAQAPAFSGGSGQTRRSGDRRPRRQPVRPCRASVLQAWVRGQIDERVDAMQGVDLKASRRLHKVERADRRPSGLEFR